MRLSLQQVTLVAIDTRAPALAAESLLRSMSQVDFGRVILFTGDWVPRRVLPQIELVQIAPIGSGADYSRFVLRQLPAHIRNSHALITQWDGFVADAAAWRHEFLTYDYVGPVWPDQPEGQNVGSGGFSLRSRRMLAAGQDPRITVEHPEDEVLCRLERPRLEREFGVRFAPAALARRFVHGGYRAKDTAFGVSGARHWPAVMGAAELAQRLQRMPADALSDAEADALLQALGRFGHHDLALALTQRLGREPGSAWPSWLARAWQAVARSTS